jgi:alcohol dehydrogenase
MHALIFDGEAAALDRSYPDPPAPAADGVVVRVRGAGVSSVDLDICDGRLPFRGPLGREIVGEVADAGVEAAQLVGARVVADPVVPCGTCDRCTAGLAAHCRNRRVLGLHGLDGGLAERVALPARNVIALPDGLDDDHAVFAVPVAEALQIRRLLAVEGASYVTVLGSSVRALLVGQVLTRMNASVRLVGRDRNQLALCERWGVKQRHVDDVGRRADQDVVIDCTRGEEGFALACEIVRPRGTIVVTSLGARGASLAPLALGELTVRGAFGGPVSEAITLLARREIDVVSLIGRRMSLDEGMRAIEAARQPGLGRVIVVP